MSLTAETLTDLPIALQSYIISKVCNFSRETLKISLEHAHVVALSLPRDLLAVAQSSRALAAATADALGTQAQVLNSGIADPLPEWITALGPAVKVVCLSYDDFLLLQDLGNLEYRRQYELERLYDEVYKTFEALSREGIALEVLDVKHVSFDGCTKESELSWAVVNALERSGQSLRELGLRVTPVWARAVARVSFPSLEVAELTLKDVDDRDEVVASEQDRSTEVLTEMLQALEEHADRTQKNTTLHELRLVTLYEVPCIDGEEGCCIGLFTDIAHLHHSFSVITPNDTSPVCFFDSSALSKLIHVLVTNVGSKVYSTVEASTDFNMSSWS